MTSLPEDNQVNPFASPRTSPAIDSLSDKGAIPLSQYATVRLGLHIIYNSIGTLAGVFMLSILSSIVLLYTVNPAAIKFPHLLVFRTFGLISLIAILALIAGFCMTLASPRSNEKSLAITSVVCFFLSIGGVLAGTLLARTVGVNEGMVLSLVASILSNVSGIFFCLLLQRIGQNISSSRLEKSARSMLLWYGIFFLAGVAGWVTMLMSISTWLEASLGVTMVGFAFIALLKYLAMLRAGTTELKPRQLAE